MTSTTQQDIKRLALVAADVGQSAMIERLSQTCPLQSMNNDVLVVILNRRMDEALDNIESTQADVAKAETTIVMACHLAGIEAADICVQLWKRRN